MKIYHNFFDQEKRIVDELHAKAGFINQKTKNLGINEMVEHEKEYLKELFGKICGFFDPTTKSSLCSAGVLWKACADVKDEMFGYSGICISATSALELEVKRCFYFGFQEFLQRNYGNPNCDSWPEMLLKSEKGELFLEKGDGKDFTIGSLPFLLGKKSLNNIKNENHRLKQEELLKEKMEEYLTTIFIDSEKNSRENLISGKDNLVFKTEKVRYNYRNPAAHCDLIGRLEAQECYISVVGKIEAFDFKSDIASLFMQLHELIDINKVSEFLN